MRHTRAYCWLLFPGLFALLVGLALALNWETVALLLFLVGLVYPGLGVSAWLVWRAFREARRPPRDALLLRACASAVVWLLGFGLLFFGLYGWLPWAPAYFSIAAGLLICAQVLSGVWGVSWALAFVLAWLVPAALYGHVGALYSDRATHAALAAVQHRLGEVMGTLRWAGEGPALVLERDRLGAQMEQLKLDRRRALSRLPLAVGLPLLPLALLLRRRRPALGWGLGLAGTLCLLLSCSAALG